LQWAAADRLKMFPWQCSGKLKNFTFKMTDERTNESHCFTDYFKSMLLVQGCYGNERVKLGRAAPTLLTRAEMSDSGLFERNMTTGTAAVSEGAFVS
jgi:hypothetical protein